jgi:hypothetical protein
MAPNGLFLQVSVTSQQVKLVGNTAEMTKNLQKIYVSGKLETRNFKGKTSNIYICFWSILEHKSTHV